MYTCVSVSWLALLIGKELAETFVVARATTVGKAFGKASDLAVSEVTEEPGRRVELRQCYGARD